ncbi:hypothetical protein Ahia01_001215000, partial [Argonauta hians]
TSSISQVISWDDFCYRNSCDRINFKDNLQDNSQESPNRIREEHLSSGIKSGMVYKNRKLRGTSYSNSWEKPSAVSEKAYKDHASVHYRRHHNHSLKLRGSKKKRKKLKRKKKARKKFKGKRMSKTLSTQHHNQKVHYKEHNANNNNTSTSNNNTNNNAYNNAYNNTNNNAYNNNTTTNNNTTATTTITTTTTNNNNNNNNNVNASRHIELRPLWFKSG